MADPLRFDFITDEELRASLESDFAELQVCLQQGAWKAAHVLSGSIVEAVLVDYLLGISYSKADPLKMTLEDLIIAARSEGALSTKAADLSTVIRGYRNLIHPGRIVRLKETVDEDGARVAVALVSMIVREVAAKQEQEFGLTAEQILGKFEADESVMAIADQLVREMRPGQLELLLLTALPDRYFAMREDAWDEEDAAALDRIVRLFHMAYEIAPEKLQKKVAKRFVAVLREEAGARVEVYEDRFFAGRFLEHLADPERKLIKDHLFARIAPAS